MAIKNEPVNLGNIEEVILFTTEFNNDNSERHSFEFLIKTMWRLKALSEDQNNRLQLFNFRDMSLSINEGMKNYF